jgi:hypothetical protein
MFTMKKSLSILAATMLSATTAMADQWTTTVDFDAAIDWEGCLAAAGAAALADGSGALAGALSGIKAVGSGVALMAVTRQGNNGTVKRIDLAAALQAGSLSFVDAGALAGAAVSGTEEECLGYVYRGNCYGVLLTESSLDLAAGGAGSESVSSSHASAFQLLSVSGKNIDELWGGLHLGTLQMNMSEAAVGELAGALEIVTAELCGGRPYGCTDPAVVDVDADYALAGALAKAIAMGRVEVWTLAHFKDNKGPGSIVDTVDVKTGANAMLRCKAQADAAAVAGSIP